jgi:NADH:ubiquinone oxidoreductase subunit 3 (subunit A)
LFLLLSRSIIVSHNIVEFAGVVILLVVFEFINLLLHPFLQSVTHDSPVFMLLALVAIAVLIVPFHHRLEKWTQKIGRKK